MFKRVTTFLTVLFMGLVLTVRSPVKADTFSIPFSAIPDLLNAFYTVAAGGKIEFSALIGDITGIDDFFENLSDYYDKHYTQPLLQSTQGLVDIGLSGLALEGIDSIDGVNNLTIPITPQDIANFMGYDINWVNNYTEPNSVVVNPDVNYLSYLDTINGEGYFFSNFPNTYTLNGNSFTAVTYPFSDYSWFVAGSGNSLNASLGEPLYLFPSNGILDIYITSQNNIYSYTVNCNRIVNAILFENYNVFAECYAFYSDGYWRADNSPTNYTSFTRSFSGTLSSVLDDISLRFRNVNIYVDGELWSYVNDNNNPAISLNNYTDVGDTGNITYGVFPLTSTGDIGLDLAKWGEYIYNQCISGVDSLSMDTVIDDGWDLVDTEDGERAITQDDEEDVAKVIHGFVGTTATTPTPTPDIGDPPVLKIIPPILELPDEIWPDGGRDTTVLAQMVHATDVAIPDDIMTIIWSTIGLLVVGGLISILHK